MKITTSVVMLGFLFVCIACDEKKTEASYASASVSDSSESAVRSSNTPTEAVQANPSRTRHCYAALPPGVTLSQGQKMPDEFEVDCSTGTPLDVQSYYKYKSMLVAAVERHNAQEAQQQVQQPSQGAVVGGEFSNSNPLGGMPIPDGVDPNEVQARIDAERSARENAQHARDIARIQADGEAQLRKVDRSFR